MILDILPLPQTLSKLRNKKMTIQQKARLFHSGTPPTYPTLPHSRTPLSRHLLSIIIFLSLGKNAPPPEKYGNHLQIATYSNKSRLFLKILPTFDQN